MSETNEPSKPKTEESISKYSQSISLIKERLGPYFNVPERLARRISFGLVTIMLVLAALTQIKSFLFMEFYVLIWYYVNKNGIEDIAEANRVKFYDTLVIFGLVILTFFAVGYDTLGIEIVVFTSFYCILAFSLNISTGMVGVLNFGVIAQVAVGAYIYGVLTVNYDMPIFQAVIWAMTGGAVFSALIAMTTLRLRDDYFAIISITLGEIIKQIAKTEPTLRSHPGTPAILSTPQPFKVEYFEFVEGTLLEDYSYRLLLGIIGLLIITILYFFTQLLLNSPYGRLFKSIREDELVVSTYGKNVFIYKVIALAISGAVAGLGGAYYAWTFNSLFPEQFTPLPTFYAWTILIVGGRANNKGIIVGAFTYEFFNRLSLFYDNQESIVLKSLRKLVGVVNPTAPDTIAVANIQLFIVGLLLIVFIRFYPNGLLPEEPYRPLIRGLKLPPPGSQSEDQKGAGSDNL